MNVFAELHNDGLYRSLWFLFEKRLGGKLFRPIGFDWHREGFWKYSGNPEVVKQYLQFDANGPDQDMGDHWRCWENKHAYYHRALAFEQFMQMDIDIIIATVSSHEEPYRRLADLHRCKPKLIRQVGNINEIVNFDLCKNIMASARLLGGVPENVNLVEYHQEFDLANYTFEPPCDKLRITNFMNCYPASRDYGLWAPYRGALPEFDWKMHGILGHDGIIGTDGEMAEAFHDTRFVWHLKYGGDGFGAIIHQAFATGRPPIVKRSYYADKMAGELMEDGVTCIDLERDSFDENIKRIRYWGRYGNYSRMSLAAHKRFCEVVNYDEEEKGLREFLGRLQ